MARFSGEVGYADQVVDPPGSGVTVAVITEKPYFGNVLRKTRTLVENEKVNQDITIGNMISIVADQYAIKNFSKIKYVRWEGVCWTVTSVEVQHPRLILNLGEVYNGATP